MAESILLSDYEYRRDFDAFFSDRFPPIDEMPTDKIADFMRWKFGNDVRVNRVVKIPGIGHAPDFFVKYEKLDA